MLRRFALLYKGVMSISQTVTVQSTKSLQKMDSGNQNFW